MAITSIEWTEASWNPVTGCSKMSTGCKNCYAERMAKRLQAMGNRNYTNGFELTLQPAMLPLPLTWKTPRLIFVNSMSDLFHEKVPFEYILLVVDIIRKASHHTFQIVTKRSKRMLECSQKREWPSNVWMGVTVEHEDVKDRVDDLRQVDAAVRFLSCEPLLSSLKPLDLGGIDWVIVGGESGPGARPMQEEWVLELRDLCATTKTPFFFKQWGGVRKKKAGRLLEGKIWDGFPLRPAPHLD